MTWFRLDDKFHAHAKIVSAGNSAVGLYVRCGCWASDHLTDGHIPHAIARIYGTPKEIAALLKHRLWVDDGTNYVMPDFLDYNPDAESVKAERAKRAEAGRLGGQRSGETRRSKREANSEASASGGASPVLEANTNPVPSRPVPSPSESSNYSSSETVTGRPADDEDVDSIIEHIATIRTRTATPKDPTRYRATVLANLNRTERHHVAAMLAEKPWYRDDPEGGAGWYELSYKAKAAAS